MNCQHCGKKFVKSRPHQIYCKLACKKADQKKVQKEELKSPYFVIPHIKRTPDYKSPVSDEEQMAINKAIDDKTRLTLETKTYRKNSKEFKELKAMYEQRGYPQKTVCALYGVPNRLNVSEGVCH